MRLGIPRHRLFDAGCDDMVLLPCSTSWSSRRCSPARWRTWVSAARRAPCGTGILDSMLNRPRSSYRELPAPDALAPYVTCLWEHRIGGGDLAYDQPVLPDGCIDLVAVDGTLSWPVRRLAR